MHERKPKMTIVVEIEGNFSTLLLKEKTKQNSSLIYMYEKIGMDTFPQRHRIYFSPLELPF